MKCLICNQEIKNSLGLSSHLGKHNIKVKDYYDKYYKKPNEGICYCGKPTNFTTFDNGYRKFCSHKCTLQSKDIRKKCLDSIIVFDDEFKKLGFCEEKLHVYRYDFDYNGQIYHYVGSTIHSQTSRAYNNYNSKILTETINKLGVKDFLLKYCTIVEWFDDKTKMTDLEEKLNIELKQQYGEEFVLSINNGRKPSKQCIEAGIKQRKIKYKTLSETHKKSIAKGLAIRNKNKILEYINKYLLGDNSLSNKIQSYIRIHYDNKFILSQDTIKPYINEIKISLDTLIKS